MITLPSISEHEDKSSPFANCLRNQARHIRKWGKRTITDCFRLFDREIRHYPIAIDYYAGRFCIHYFSPVREQIEPPQEFVQEIERVLKNLFEVQPENIFWRTRAKRKETRQYEKIGESREFFVAHEYGLQFKINLIDYLDTGLFLDHRETRRLVASHAAGKRVLNLFAYTCSFSVHAAAAGAAFTKSVDLSNTYTQWGRDNFLLNQLPTKTNPIVRADCLKFLEEEIDSGTRYDLIVIDPPTISRSKKMERLFDIQTDYIDLISKALALLQGNGMIFFSTNSRKFVLDTQLFPACQIVDVTQQTIPLDFRDHCLHRCWKIIKRDNL